MHGWDTIRCMSQALNRLEARLQRLIEEGTARLFSGEDMRKELEARLCESMETEVAFNAEGQLVAPHVYTIEVNTAHAEALKSNAVLLDELSAEMVRQAEELQIHLLERPVVHISPAEDMPTGEFRVRCAAAGKTLEETQSLKGLQQIKGPRIPPGAFLIVNGAEIYSLTEAIINIGRKKDNQLVLDDPHVSRRHAQLRAITGQYHFFDLSSTGGSEINGQKVKNAVLHAGDVIRLAGVPLIFGQDEMEAPGETQEYKPDGRDTQGTPLAAKRPD